MLCNSPYCCHPAAYRLVFTKRDADGPRTFMRYACTSHREYLTRVWTEDAAEYVSCTLLRAKHDLHVEPAVEVEAGTEEHAEADLLFA